MGAIHTILRRLILVLTMVSITKIARRLRREATPTEKEMWMLVRNRKFYGYKILRQHPIVYEYEAKRTRFFVADFYCAASNLVIEIDGKIHDYSEEHDYNRDLICNELGLNVLRIKNEEFTNVALVKMKLLAAFQYK